MLKQRVRADSILDKLNKISGPTPTKLCKCGLYLIMDTEKCDLCKIFGKEENHDKTKS